MKRSIVLLALCIVIGGLPEIGLAKRDPSVPKPDEVCIYFNGVELPLNRILLIRRENTFCALKFIRAWTEIDEKEWRRQYDDISEGGILGESARDMATKKYAVYETFRQMHGSPDFSIKNVQKQEGTASWLPIKGFMHPFVYQPGKPYIDCGEARLGWGYKTFVSFIPEGIHDKNRERDHGVELAPTMWTDMKQVNVKDHRIMWYRFDERRGSTCIPIDKFWAPKTP